MKAKFESSYDENFPEESASYYGLLLKYAKLTDVDGNTACRLAIEALIYADRYNTIANDAAKLENLKGTKGDMQKFFYGRYRTLHLMHEHCVAINNNCNYQARNYGKGT